MALLAGELMRLRAELGYNVLNVGAEPYIGITSLFDGVIAPNLSAGAVTTSSTSVTASATPALTSLTLESVTGFAVGARAVLDFDSRQESATVESITGSTIALLLSKVHSGTYQVTVESGEAIVREYLTRIREVKERMGKTFGAGALKKVDEVEFYDTKGLTLFGALGDQLMYWRSELASVLGIQDMWSRRSRAGQTLSVY